MRPDPSLWQLQADRVAPHGLLGEPITGTLGAIALMLAVIAFPGRVALSLIMEFIR